MLNDPASTRLTRARENGSDKALRSGSRSGSNRNLRCLRSGTWQRCVQLRCSQLSGALHAVERAVTEGHASRGRGAAGTWRVFGGAGQGQVEVVAEVRAGRVRRWSDFRKNIRVVLLRADLVDLVALRDALDRLGVPMEVRP